MEELTSIQKDHWGVHVRHCCKKHGCKYRNDDCPVVLKLIEQEYLCELCLEELAVKENEGLQIVITETPEYIELDDKYKQLLAKYNNLQHSMKELIKEHKGVCKTVSDGSLKSHFPPDYEFISHSQTFDRGFEVARLLFLQKIEQLEQIISNKNPNNHKTN